MVASLPTAADEAETYAEIDVEKRSTALFAVPILGETYDELTGAIGHQATDMTLTGNGPLRYDVVRRYQEQPEGYPYAFGTMSLVTPTLVIDTRYANNARVSPTEFRCGEWATPRVNWRTVRDVHETISFEHERGTAKLISRDLLGGDADTTDDFINRFPATALYASKDHYWLRCEGPRFVVTAPDGVEYVFSATWNATDPAGYGLYNQGASERTIQSRVRQTGSDADDQEIHTYNVFRLRVVEKRRLTARLKYFHEYADPTPYGQATGQQGYKAGPPVVVPARKVSYSSRYRTEFDPVFEPFITHKMRLRRVELHSPGEPVRAVDFSYHAMGDQCGGLLSGVASSSTIERSVKYEYTSKRGLASGTPRSFGMPWMGCALTKVVRADNSSWEFKYGMSDTPRFPAGDDPNPNDTSAIVMLKDNLHTTTTDFYAGEGSYPKETDNQITWSAYMPLRSVKVPTGAVATYWYKALGQCEYQDYERRTREVRYNTENYSGTNSCRYGNSTSAYRRPAVTSRRVEGADFPTSSTYIRYDKLPSQYQVRRWVADSARTTVLTFHRVDRLSHPDASNSSTRGRQVRDSGRLAEITVYPGSVAPWTISLPEALATASYTYKVLFPELARPDNKGWWGGYWWFEVEDTGDPSTPTFRNWAQINARNNWRYDANRVVPLRTAISVDGASSAASIITYDTYDNPTWVIESQTIGTTTTARSTNRTYKNSTAISSEPWQIGLPRTTSTGSGDTDSNGTRTMQYTEYVYNDNGLVSKRVTDGVSTWFFYNADGTLYAKNEGGSISRYKRYTHGIPREETIDGVSDKITREVTSFGGIAWEETADGGRTTYEYRLELTRFRRHCGFD